MNYEVQLWYDGLTESASLELPRMAVAERASGVGVVGSTEGRIEPENQGRGFDFVKFVITSYSIHYTKLYDFASRKERQA